MNRLHSTQKWLDLNYQRVNQTQNLHLNWYYIDSLLFNNNGTMNINISAYVSIISHIL